MQWDVSIFFPCFEVKDCSHRTSHCLGRSHFYTGKSSAYCLCEFFRRLLMINFFPAVKANFAINQTESGWQKGDAFFYYVTQHLYPRWTEMKLDRPIVLVIDGNAEHHSFKLQKWCREHQIELIILFPNATHILQVCDVALFGPLKSKFSELFQTWKSNNPTKIFDEIEFVKLLKTVNDEVIKKESIVNGWRATGLQPFRFENIDMSRVAGASSPTSKLHTTVTIDSVEDGRDNFINLVPSALIEAVSEASSHSRFSSSILLNKSECKFKPKLSDEIRY